MKDEWHLKTANEQILEARAHSQTKSLPVVEQACLLSQRPSSRPHSVNPENLLERPDNYLTGQIKTDFTARRPPIPQQQISV
jgi:hypothetical protein